jgi:hypothetical protein
MKRSKCVVFNPDLRVFIRPRFDSMTNKMGNVITYYVKNRPCKHRLSATYDDKHWIKTLNLQDQCDNSNP